LLGKRVTTDGQDKDPVPFQVDTATQGVLRNAVAAQSGNCYAVAWLDGRNGSSQPADAVAVAAAIVDSTVAGTTGTPLAATISASPNSGPPPLTVFFSSALSQGSYDTIHWDFGDGTTASTAEATHAYKTKGTYIAQLTLTQGSYAVSSTTLITVGTGVWSDAPTPIGVPVQSTADLVPELSIRACNVYLDFKEAGKDSITISGVIENGALPNDLTGTFCAASIGSFTTSFSLDASGQFKSDATQPSYTSFALTKTTGSFLFSITNANLVSAMDALGARNENVVSSDKRIVAVPLSLIIGGFSATAQCGIQYVAVQNNTGSGSYFFQKKGHEVSGSFTIAKFSAKESKQKTSGTKVHAFAIQGQLIRPNAMQVVSASAGAMVFSIGNYSVTLPGTSFASAKGSVKLTAKRAAAGLSQFTLNAKGKFTLKLANIPAADSGLPTANSDNNMLNANLNLSFQFDMSDGTQLDAGRFILIDRTGVGAKSWVLRQ
jgi:PKD repeat protein